MLNYLPRLLLIDMTAMEGHAATSALKRAYFGDWRKSGLLHVRSGGHGHVLTSALDGNEIRLPRDEQTVKKLIETFQPEVILYRPVADHAMLHQSAMQLIAASEAPLIIWMMDDWPARLKADAPQRAAAIDADLKILFERSSLNLAISEGMSRVFAARYGVSFGVAHNGINPTDWPTRLRDPSSTGAPLKLRYAGSLAPDTTKDSVFAVAKAVSQLAEAGHPICFEGHTQAHWHRQFADDFNALPAVSMKTSDLDEPAYRSWLSAADIALLAYNFDEATQRYLQYSFANKMPELLASGAALLALGPLQLETLAYLQRHKLGKIVSTPDDQAIKAALTELIASPDLRGALGKSARDHAFSKFDFAQSRMQLLAEMDKLLADKPPAFRHHFPNEQKMRLNECQLIADVLGATAQPGVMIDVGAHLGSSLLPFAKSGWTVLAFEPDEVNRKALLEAVASFPDVHVSDNAVGRQIEANAAFYRSDVSSGISSLTAFHESHEPGQSVAVTTLDHIVAQTDLTEIDFLKVDVEGHEMDVLDGFDLTKIKPRAIMLEFEDGKAVGDKSAIKALADRLLHHDYHVYVSEWHKVVEYGRAHDWRQMTPYPAQLAPDSWGNLIAFREPPSERILETALHRNIAGKAFGATALETLVALAPKPTKRRQMLTWVAVNLPWVRTLWRRLKSVARS